MGSLAGDWLAATVDSTPAFTLLISLTYSLLPEAVFYLYYALLMGVYLYCLIGIAATLYDVGSSTTRTLTYAASLIAVHSAAFRFLLSRIPDSHWGHLFEAGVAGQRLLGPVFQPSTFGVFLLLSVLCFLRGRRVLAVVSAGIAATLHPTYLLSAAVLTVIYMATTYRESGDLWKPLLLGSIALLLVVPITTYVVLALRPTSPRLSAQALQILVEDRLPHHALPAEWLDTTVLIKTLIVGSAAYLSRRTPLGRILWVSALAAIGLTLLQVITGSQRLALLFPWRLSTFLVPMSTALLLGWLLSRMMDRLQKGGGEPAYLRWAALASIAALAAAGVANFAYDAQRKYGGDAAPMLTHVSQTRTPSAVYFIPPKLQDFRLAAGAPAFVDFKSIPYRDVEVLEWSERLRLANFFYRDRLEEIDCGLLARAEEMGGVTHVVLASEQLGLECPAWAERYRDEAYAVYELK